LGGQDIEGRFKVIKMNLREAGCGIVSQLRTRSCEHDNEASDFLTSYARVNVSGKTLHRGLKLVPVLLQYRTLVLGNRVFWKWCRC